MTIKKLLIANRGEIACRIIKTCQERGIETVALFTPYDRASLHRQLADEAFELSFDTAPLGYLDTHAICEIAIAAGVHAIHPGYGFLSENAAFAQAVNDCGILFIGPSAQSIKISGDKILSKEQALAQKVPCVPGILLDAKDIKKQLATARSFAKTCGYPIIAKAAAGGGGRGMRQIHTESELAEALSAASREAAALFGDGRIFLEKLVMNARHIEVQIIADSFGAVRHLGDRDCSYQRRHQKIIEEAPAPSIPSAVRQAIHDSAVKLLSAIGYQSLATVEFLLDRDENFYFLEVNSRLQVEHPVTEFICGLDLVGLQIDIAQDKKLSDLLPDALEPQGHAIELRLCAENPFQNFQPSQGRFYHLHFKEGALDKNPTLRFDSGYRCGDRMGLQYDSLIGKIIGFADTRQAAIEQVKHAAQQLVCFGVETNLSFLIALLDNSDFSAIKHHVQSIQADALEALSPAMLACLGALYAFGDCPVASVWDTSIERPLSVRILGMHVHALLSKFQDLITVTLNEEEFQFKLNPQDKTISTDGQCFSYQIFRSSDKDVWLWCPFGNFFVEKYYEPLKLDQGTTATSRFVVAHLPGKVLKLHVAPGDIVEADQALISIESMKMEHVFRAPLAGTVNSIKVEENSLVESGELLVELDY